MPNDMTTDSQIVISRTPVVFAKDGAAFASSRDVAEFFEKDHRNVLRDIRNLIAKGKRLERNFEPFKINDLTGESTSHYEMNRDGFTLLILGFTGPKALDFKIAYIEAFNKMEATLRAAHAPGSITINDIAAVQAQVNTMNTKLEAIQAQIATVISGFDQTQAMIVGYKSMLDIVKDNGAVAKGRRSLVQRCSRLMLRWCLAEGRADAIKVSRESGRYLFHVDSVTLWLAFEGRAVIVAHKDKVAGQGVLTLVPKTRADDPQPAQ